MYLSRRLQGHTQCVTSIACTHDSTAATNRILSGSELAELCVWSGHDGVLVKKLQLPNEEDSFMSIECSRLNTNIFYASVGTRILGYDLRSFESPFQEINVSEDEINSIVLDEAENMIAIADDSGTVKLYDLSCKKLHRILRRHSNMCSSVLFRPGRPHEVVSGGYDHRLLQWDFVRSKCFCNIDVAGLTGVDTPSDTLTLNPPQIHSLSLSKDGGKLACGLENSVVLLMDASRRTLSWLCNLRGHRKGVSQVHFPRHSDRLLVSAGNDNQLCLWDVDPQLPINHSQTNGHAHPSSPANEIDSSASTNNNARRSSNRNRSNRSNRNNARTTNQPPAREPIFRIQCEENFNWLSSGIVGGVNFLLVAGNSTWPSIYNFSANE